MGSRITPMDIENQVFSRKLRGWDSQEVQLYLQSVAEEIQRLNLENGDLREEVGKLTRDLEAFQSREKTLQETLVAAQRMGEELKDKARQDSELLVKEARVRAEEITQQARLELNQLDTEIGRRQVERDNLERQMRGIIEQHLSMLDMRKQAQGKVDNLRVMRKHINSEVV